MNEFEARMIQDSLEEIAAFFREGQEGNGTVAFYEMLAGKLSRAAGRADPWTWRYVQGVHKGTIGPSRVFGRAVMAMGAQLDGTPAVAANTEAVEVLVRPGTVREGAVVLGEAKVCARPGCRAWFVGRVPWQKYCCVECRKRSNQ